MTMKPLGSDGHRMRRLDAPQHDRPHPDRAQPDRPHSDRHSHAGLGADADDVEVAARLFHGLADPGRLRILRHLQLGEHRVVDLTAHLGLAQSTVSAHVACLRDCGLLDVRHQGRSSFYRLAHPDATELLLRAGEQLIGAALGDAVDTEGAS